MSDLGDKLASEKTYTIPMSRDGRVAVIGLPLPIRDSDITLLRAWIDCLESSFAPAEQPAELDGCVFCLGAKGNTPGNENRIGGLLVCDCCHSRLMQMGLTKPMEPTPQPNPLAEPIESAFREGWSSGNDDQDDLAELVAARGSIRGDALEVTCMHITEARKALEREEAQP